MKRLFFTCCMLCGMQVFAQQQQSAPQRLEKMELKEYFFVMLKAGPNPTKDTLAARKLQAAHLDNINKMAREGKLAVAGPFGDDGNWRGIFIFKTKTLEEAKALVEQDPMVKVGHLSYEIHPWWTVKGAKLD